MIELLARLGLYPRSCVWEITLACNMRCGHCGSHAGAARDDELSLDECFELAGELARLGCRRVTLSGGEPTIHPGWDEIACRLIQNGVVTNIISNGWTWSEQHVQKAQAVGLSNAGFSLDGFEQVHDAIRKPGSFKRTVAALDLCRAHGLETAVATHINRRNAEQLTQMRDFLAKHGVTQWQLQLGVAAGHMTEHLDWLIEPADLLWIIPAVAQMRQQADRNPRVRTTDHLGYFGKYESGFRDWNVEDVDFWIGCRAGLQILGIESNGTIKGCLSLPSSKHDESLFVEGNTREGSLTTIWRDPKAFAITRQFNLEQLTGFCAVCRYADICRGGCVWTAFSQSSGKLDNPYCFYRQAVIHRRFDLLGDDQPSKRELAWAGVTESRSVI